MPGVTQSTFWVTSVCSVTYSAVFLCDRCKMKVCLSTAMFVTVNEYFAHRAGRTPPSLARSLLGLIAKLACGPCVSWPPHLLHFRRWYLARYRSVAQRCHLIGKPHHSAILENRAQCASNCCLPHIACIFYWLKLRPHQQQCRSNIVVRHCCWCGRGFTRSVIELTTISRLPDCLSACIQNATDQDVHLIIITTC